MSALRVHYLPQLVDPADLADSTCIVIDVLRATTVIVHALAAGALEVVPCLEIDEARDAAARYAPDQAVLGGERGGLRIEGFHFGNSPAEFIAQAVSGKSLVFTTTNGTRAIRHCSQAAEVWMAAFVNLSALCAAAAQRERIDLLCAGTNAQITREDVLLAGAIVERLTTDGLWGINDQAALARDAWLAAVGASSANGNLAARLSQVLRDTQGGRNLTALKLEADIDDAAQIDRFTLVPRLDRARGRIVG